MTLHECGNLVGFHALLSALGEVLIAEDTRVRALVDRKSSHMLYIALLVHLGRL